jgi:hypothetical protein
MFKGKGKKKEPKTPNYENEVVEDINMNEYPKDHKRFRISDESKDHATTINIEQSYSRHSSSGMTVEDEGPKLQRGLKARHVGFFFDLVDRGKKNFF